MCGSDPVVALVSSATERTPPKSRSVIVCAAARCSHLVRKYEAESLLRDAPAGNMRSVSSSRARTAYKRRLPTREYEAATLSRRSDAHTVPASTRLRGRTYSV